MIVLVIAILSCLAHSHPNCTHTYHVQTINQPYFFKVQVIGKKPVSFCIVTPKWNVSTIAVFHFNHFNCLKYDERVRSEYTTDNSTVFINQIMRECQRSKSWKHRDNQPGANYEEFVVAIKETTKIAGIVVEWAVIKMVLLIVFMIALLFKPVETLLFSSKSPFVVHDKQQ